LKIKNFAKNKFFIIIDKYQSKYDLIDILEKFQSFKIFLLSSINDGDVKCNLILTYQEKSLKEYNIINKREIENIIRYSYYENLLNLKKFYSKKIKDKIKEKIKSNEKETEMDINTDEVQKKITEEEADEDMTQLKEKEAFIIHILGQFNFIPKYYYKYINTYETIYDLLFTENKKIFKKLIEFESRKTINIIGITQLLSEKNLVLKTESENPNYNLLPEEKFIEYLRYMPLKYINFHLNNNGQLYFYYSFPLFKQILNDFLGYSKAKDNFLITNKDSERSAFFEKLVVLQLKIFNSLNIDGHLEVTTIMGMNFTDNYKLLDKEYLKGKKNILITQLIDGKDYDFAIYKPEENNLLLFQSKYQIEHKLIKEKVKYLQSGLEVLNNFKKAFKNKSIKNVFLLYISSEEFNTNRRATVHNLLKNNQINCLFYSVKNNSFSYDFKEKINDLACEDSFMLLPNIGQYEIKDILPIKKKLSKNKNTEITFLKKKIKRNYDNKKVSQSLKEFFANQNIDISFGQLYQIDNFKGKMKMDKQNEYLVIFSFKEIDDSIINLNKPIGIIYFENENGIYLEVTQNKLYSSYEELFDNFSNDSYYGVGEKAIS
jgi:hypothetical protein